MKKNKKEEENKEEEKKKKMLEMASVVIEPIYISARSRGIR